MLLRLNLPADRPLPWIDLYLEELAVWNVFLPIQLYLFQRDQVWIDFNPVTVLHAYRYSFRCGPHHTPYLDLSAERLSASIQSFLFQFGVCSAYSMSVKTCVHRTAPSASWQPPCRKIFVKCLEMLTNSQSLLCCALAQVIFQSRWLKPMSISFGFGAASCPKRVFTLRLCAPATRRLRRKHGSRILVFNFCGIN